MFARLSAFVIWSLVAATLVFWALRFTVRAAPAPAYAVAVAKGGALHGDLTRLFGAAPVVAVVPEAVPEAPSRFRLLGLMAPRAAKSQETAAYGLAVIAIDGKPAKAFAVGSRVDNDLVLQSVGLRTASIGPAQGARSVLLELPALAAPSTGVLPAPGAPAQPGPMVPAMQPGTRMSAPVPNVAAPAAPPLAVVPQPAIIAQPQMVPQPVPMQAVPNPGMPSPDNFRSQ